MQLQDTAGFEAECSGATADEEGGGGGCPVTGRSGMFTCAGGCCHDARSPLRSSRLQRCVEWLDISQPVLDGFQAPRMLLDDTIRSPVKP